MNSNFNCLLCNSLNHYQVISEQLRDDFSHNIKVVRCLTCGHIQLTPLPSQEENQLFYNNDSQTRNLMGETDLKLWQVKSEQDTKRRQKWLSNLIAPHSKILDIGCGYGFFVDELTKHSCQAVGIDVSKERIDLAQTHLSGKFIQGWIDNKEFTQRYHHYFDAVTLFHVLEHIPEPVAFIRQCFDLVSPNGFLLIEVPNLADELLDYSEEYKDFFWQCAHLSYFDHSHLALTLYNAGLSNFKINGCQRYGFRNLLNWIDEGKPQLTSPHFSVTHPLLQYFEDLYKKNRCSRLTCDTLIVEVKK